MPVAVGTSLLVIAINSAAALGARFAGPGVDWRTALPFTVLALLGSLAGERLGRRVNSRSLVKWFVVLLAAVAAYTAARAALAL